MIFTKRSFPKSFQRSLQKSLQKGFSSNPYFLLDCQPTDPFPVIKAKFYKLAQEFHPDKNPAPEAKTHFLKIKAAYEDIQIQKGLKQPLRGPVVQEKHDSVRPNPEFYTENQEENSGKNGLDFKEFSFRAKQSDEFEQYAGSLRTMANLKDIKFRPDEGEMKDMASRFNLGDSQKIKVFSDGGSLFGIVILGWLGAVIWAANRGHEVVEIQEKERNLEKMGRDGGADEEIEAMVGEERRFVEFKKRVSDKEIVRNYRLDMYVPKREEFYIAK